MEWLAGNKITAERLNDHTPVTLATTPTPGTGFSLSSFNARKTNGVVEWGAVFIYGGSTLTATSDGNIIGDPVVCTLPTDCRPGSQTVVGFDKSGVASGSIRISTNGDCQITSLDPTATIASGATINFSGAFVTG